MKTIRAFSNSNENPINFTAFALFLFNCMCYNKMPIVVKESKSKNVSINFKSLCNSKAGFNVVGECFQQHHKADV